jgi:DNA-binding transcriptional regulator YbjK
VPDVDSSHERHVRIADAALSLLAREGARGLTHRAVDAELSLPSGSTSYYYRTRAALLLAAAQRLLALDAADAQNITPDAAGLANLLGRWVSPAGRLRSLARMELLLAAARDPGLEFMVDARKQFIAQAEQELRGQGSETALPQAIALIAMMDGLTLHGLVTRDLGVSTAQRILDQQTALTGRTAKSRTKAQREAATPKRNPKAKSRSAHRSSA